MDERTVSPDVPAVFANSIPKSGTHLLLQALSAVPGLEPPLQPPFQHMPHLPTLSEQFVTDRARLLGLGPGGLAFGHVCYSPEWAALLVELGFSRLFLIRDPRDVAVSLMHYATRKEPSMRGLAHLSTCLHSDHDRLLALITGFAHDGIARPDIGTHQRWFLPWRDQPGVLTVTFEELVGTSASRCSALTRVLRHVVGHLPADEETAAVAAMAAAINPATSGTFRRGMIGSWREEFDETTTRVFKAVAGDLLIELGYESDNDW